jgi:hypothetical protein
MKIEKYLLLDWKKLLIIVLTFVAAVLLHNIFYGITGYEEPLFFLIATVIVPFYFIIAVFYTAFYYGKKLIKKK